MIMTTLKKCETKTNIKPKGCIKGVSLTYQMLVKLETQL